MSCFCASVLWISVVVCVFVYSLSVILFLFFCSLETDGVTVLFHWVNADKVVDRHGCTVIF